VTILVVDDEPPVMQLCTMVLELQGYAVEGFTRGEEFLARLATLTPDLAVVDYKMPGMGGVAVVQQARARLPELKVLMITGHGSQEVMREATAVGASGVLLKPFTPAELAQTVASLLDR
jgi:CheY-like chemotaxis protein